MGCPCYACASVLAIFGGFFLLKLYVKLTTGMYKGKERLDNKTVIITGASAGIGYETAKDLAKRGARIIMVCRNLQKAEKCKEEIIMATGNGKILVKQMDLSSLQSVRKCALEIASQEKKIDILVNNAGMLGPKLEFTEDGLEQTLQTNHYGPFLFTNILLDNIVNSAPSKIINVSSIAYKFRKMDLQFLANLNKSNAVNDMDLYYSNSKLANIYFTNVLAEKLKAKGVTVNSLHPGVVSTDILPEDQLLMRFIYWVIKLFGKTSREGAQTTIYLCCSPEVDNVSGEYFADCKKQNLNSTAKDLGVAKKLWEISEDAVKMKPEERIKF